MPQDPGLYGQRAAKRHKKETALPSSLAFSSSLSSLIAKPSSSAQILPASSTNGRARPSKAKQDVFSNVKIKRKAQIDNEDKSASRKDGKLNLRDVRETEDEKAEALRGRRKMEEKARLYAAMQRGDYVAKDGEAAPLVDFDRKWAEKQDKNEFSADSSSDDDSQEDRDETSKVAGDDEQVTWEDEFGRMRTGTHAEKERMERKQRAKELGASDLERMAARPQVAPQDLIFGDVIQAEAFVAADEEAMEDLARRRDRSATPPEMKHYDANAEIRSKGVGFFQFSKDEEARKTEMEDLAKERAETEKKREEREEKERDERDKRRQARQREIDERKKQVEQRRKTAGQKRAAKLADNFLDGLAADMPDGG